MALHQNISNRHAHDLSALEFLVVSAETFIQPGRSVPLLYRRLQDYHIKHGMFGHLHRRQNGGPRYLYPILSVKNSTCYYMRVNIYEQNWLTRTHTQIIDWRLIGIKWTKFPCMLIASRLDKILWMQTISFVYHQACFFFTHSIPATTSRFIQYVRTIAKLMTCASSRSPSSNPLPIAPRKHATGGRGRSDSTGTVASTPNDLTLTT